MPIFDFLKRNGKVAPDADEETAGATNNTDDNLFFLDNYRKEQAVSQDRIPTSEYPAVQEETRGRVKKVIDDKTGLEFNVYENVDPEPFFDKGYDEKLRNMLEASRQGFKKNDIDLNKYVLDLNVDDHTLNILRAHLPELLKTRTYEELIETVQAEYNNILARLISGINVSLASGSEIPTVKIVPATRKQSEFSTEFRYLIEEA